MCISNITPETQFSMLKPIIIQALHHICGFITTCGWVYTVSITFDVCTC